MEFHPKRHNLHPPRKAINLPSNRFAESIRFGATEVHFHISTAGVKSAPRLSRKDKLVLGDFVRKNEHSLLSQKREGGGKRPAFTTATMYEALRGVEVNQCDCIDFPWRTRPTPQPLPK